VYVFRIRIRIVSRSSRGFLLRFIDVVERAAGLADHCGDASFQSFALSLAE
jgi:hypothetical protein